MTSNDLPSGAFECLDSSFVKAPPPSASTLPLIEAPTSKPASGNAVDSFGKQLPHKAPGVVASTESTAMAAATAPAATAAVGSGDAKVFSGGPPPAESALLAPGAVGSGGAGESALSWATVATPGPPPPAKAPPGGMITPQWKAPPPSAATVPVVAQEAAPGKTSSGPCAGTVPTIHATAPAHGNAAAAAAAVAKVAATNGIGAGKEAGAEAPWKKRRRGSHQRPSGAGTEPAGGSALTAAAQVSTAAHRPKTSVPQPGVADRAAAERIAASAERLASAAFTGSNAAMDLVQRKVAVSNLPPAATVTELADFFTGAIFSATGHTLAAQWQSGEASKVVVGVELGAAGTGPSAAEVTFGTALSAHVSLALNGIQFQGKALGIKRPKGYTGPPAPRMKLQNVSIKDLIASDSGNRGITGGATPAFAGQGEGGAFEQPQFGAVVRLSGIPSSMGSESVFDLLQQFGGPLRGLHLDTQMGKREHLGGGSAEYMDKTSAVEAVRFSPLLGFIEVAHAEGVASLEAAGIGEGASELPSAKRLRRSRFDNQLGADGVAEDLGPFEAALQQREQAHNAQKQAPSDGLDLGPFEAVLPPSRQDGAGILDVEEDLGPFEAILPRKAAASLGPDDLGPFEAVLPPARQPGEEGIGGFAVEERGMPFAATAEHR